MKKLLLLLLCLSLQCAYAEQTLSIIKPDAVKAKKTGQIIARFECEGFTIAAMKKIQLTQKQAEEFYQEHKDRPFYRDLVAFMTSGPVVVMVLDEDNAIQKNRALMGATDPKKSKPWTLRAIYGQSIDHNAVHGSDSKKSAQREISFFFDQSEIN